MHSSGIDVFFGFIERNFYKGVLALEKYQYDVCLKIDLSLLTIENLDCIISILFFYENRPEARVTSSKANLIVARLYY